MIEEKELVDKIKNLENRFLITEKMIEDLKQKVNHQENPCKDLGCDYMKLSPLREKPMQDMEPGEKGIICYPKRFEGIPVVKLWDGRLASITTGDTWITPCSLRVKPCRISIEEEKDFMRIKFNEFLRNVGAIGAFYKNLADGFKEELFLQHEPNRWLSHAFSWSDSKEGFNFWFDINNEWSGLLKEEKETC